MWDLLCHLLLDGNHISNLSQFYKYLIIIFFILFYISWFIFFGESHIPTTFVTFHTVSVSAFWLSVKQYFTSPKPSQDVRFWRVLICILNIPNAGHFVNFWYTYMNDFYFHCHDKDLWSSSLSRLYWWWKMSHICFPLYNTAIVLCCIPPTKCKVLLLYYYCYRWVDCLEAKCRFLMETDSLESIEFLC